VERSSLYSDANFSLKAQRVKEHPGKEVALTRIRYHAWAKRGESRMVLAHAVRRRADALVAMRREAGNHAILPVAAPAGLGTYNSEVSARRSLIVTPPA
jgi:hypothetical protein